MRVGVLGSGVVAKVLAAGFLKHDHEVMMGTRDPAKLSDWATKNPKGRIGSFGDAAKFADLVVLAVKGTAAADALHAEGAETLTGKPVIDATNPITDAPITFAGISTLIVCVSLLANYIPARKACRVDPMVALRYN